MTTPTHEVWELLARPLDAVRAIEALLGISSAAARLMTSTLLATSAEADALLTRMPRLLRSLAIATAARPERCRGEVRGPVLWSETMAARGASAGDSTLFVCSIAERAYDTPENRILAAALATLASAATQADASGLRARNTSLARHARHNGSLAIRFADHRTLSGVTRGRPDARELRRARSGLRRRTYQTAIAFLERASEPVTADHLAALADPATAAQHGALVAVVRELRRRGHGLPPLQIRAGAVVSGPVTYLHSRSRRPGPTGIQVGALLLDVAVDAEGRPVDPQAVLDRLAARADGRSCAVLAGDGDLAWALDRTGW